MLELGFTQGRACPCIFLHANRQLYSTIHDDDLTTAGCKQDLDWCEAALSGHYGITKGCRLGPGKADSKQGLILNRVIRLNEEGLEYEADPRQAERILEEIGLKSANSAAAPRVELLAQQISEDKELPASKCTAYRARAARGNFLAIDRHDAQFASKELCRWMSKPTEPVMSGIKRMCRYLGGKPRRVFLYPFQDADTVDCYSDTGWSGCTRTRKSTSGGCLMLGCRVMTTWNTTQPSVSLSSAVAEFYGVVKASGLALGQQSLLRDLGLEVPIRVWTDSSAARDIWARHGAGKLCHIATHALWVQEKLRNTLIDQRKARGEGNLADVLTKHLARVRIEYPMKRVGCVFRRGRPDGAPQLIRGTTEEAEELNAISAEDDDKIEMHDEKVLPHRYTIGDIDCIFPLAWASPADEDEEVLEKQAEWELREPTPPLATRSIAAPTSIVATPTSTSTFCLPIGPASPTISRSPAGPASSTVSASSAGAACGSTGKSRTGARLQPCRTSDST